MKPMKLEALILLIGITASTAWAQIADSTERSFTLKGSRLNSVVGSIAHQTQEGKDAITLIALGWSHLTFAGDNFAPGVDWRVARIQEGSNSITQMAFGPKFVAAFGVPQAPVYPYFGFGYNLLVNWVGEDDAALGHILKVGLGVVIEPVEHLGIPLEFTINFPLGEDSDFKIYGFSIGFAVLGY